MTAPFRSFGSYVLFKEILADELGHLYRAGELDRTGLKHTVWLRVFDGASVSSTELAGRAETANRIGEILRAANVAANPRVVVEKGVAALAWDYVSGQPLSLLLRKVRAEGFPVPVDNALLIVEKLSVGLAAAMAVDVEGTSLIHGFLHPGLVVVTHDGEGLVAGFGVADQLLGLLDEGAAAPAIRPYLAPEVLMSRVPSRRGDVYSLGAILFELLTGEPLPEQPEARAGALDSARTGDDEQPMPADLKGLLQRALASRPEDRHSSAADFKNELDKLLYGGAYSPTTFNLALFMDRLFRFEVESEARDRPAESEVNAELYLRREPEPVVDEVVAPAPPRGRGLGPWIAIAAGVVVVGILTVVLLGRGGGEVVAPPTPTAQQLEAQKVADSAKVKELVERELGRLMAEKEKEIREELSRRQAKIDEYQKKLKDLQPAAGGGTETAEAKRSRQNLERQIAAEQAAKAEEERRLESERQRALEEARRKATETAQRASVPTPGPVAPTPVTAETTAARPEPTAIARVEPTAVPSTESDMVPPELVNMVKPGYPAAAVRVGAEGDVELRIRIGQAGDVLEVEVLKGLKWGLTEEAVKAVKQWKYRPATRNGAAVETTITVSVHFGLSGGRRR